MLKRFDAKPVSGRLVYLRSERSLDVEPPPERGVASLLINDVQIEIDEDGRLVCVSGLCPHESWAPARLDPPSAKVGGLQYVNGTVIPGVSKRLNTDNRWPARFDPSSGWLCIGDASVQTEAVAFAPGAIAVLTDDELAALWLHPEAQE
jgi:hypothetical protein